MKIALLATGDELVNGDILNTNGQTIAQTLFDKGFELGNQMTVRDNEKDIIEALNYLSTQHAIIIITGGLGPTSDDRTRFALAKASQRKLFFCPTSWKSIEERLARYNKTPHECNRQQAYFPTGAIVLPNPHGTAAGCQLTTSSTIFFMLPGPPKECLPMFFDQVLPKLLAHFCQSGKTPLEEKKWRLFGVSEGEIAAELDTIAQGYPVTTGYRWDYPYLEFKLKYDRGTDLKNLLDQLNQRLADMSICSPEQTALEILLTKTTSFKPPLKIYDEATVGLLQYRLNQAKSHLLFVPRSEADICILGLEELWQDPIPSKPFTHLLIKGRYNNIQISEQKEIPLHSRQVINYAIEYIAFHLTKILKHPE